MTTHLQTATNAQASLPISQSVNGLLQRKCDCGNHTAASQCDACDKKRKITLQRSAIGSGPSEGVPAIVHDALRSPGRPLDSATRAFFEPRFGHDFSQVRVHDDSSATESARAVKALAYTVGNDVIFGAGQYEPTTPDGRKLLAHELTHVVQQGKGQGLELQRAPEGADPGGAPEDEARQNADTMTEEEEPTPADTGKKKNASCTRTIFAEGTCQFLVENSKYICCDPDNGFERKGRTKDIEDTPCPSEKFTPIFTCDSKCNKALAKGCDDNDNWMAIPDNQFTRGQCGDVWTICANGKQTTGYVRDHSVTHSRFEVSPKIQKDLGVTVGSSFKGSVYTPKAKQSAIGKDKCCVEPKS